MWGVLNQYSIIIIRRVNFKISYNDKVAKYYIPIVLLIVNFICKYIFISNDSIAGDEPFSIYHAQMDIYSIIRLLSMGNNPPLFEIILHFWIKMFGISSFSVRFLPMIFSVTAVYFIYKIGIKFFNLETAILASLLYTFSSLHTGLAHETRVYSLLTMLASISMYLFFDLINSSKYWSKNWRLIVCLSIVNVLLIYAHYFGFFVIVVQVLSLLCIKFENKKNVIKTYFTTICISIIFYLPNIAVLLSRFIDSASHGTWLSAPRSITNILDVFRTFLNEEYGRCLFHKPIISVLVVILILVQTVRVILKKVDFDNNKKIIFIWFFFPYLFMFFVSYLIPMYKERYLIITSIGLYFLIALLLSNISTQKRRLYVILPFLALYIVSYSPKYNNKRDVKATIAKVKELKNNRILVFISPD